MYFPSQSMLGIESYVDIVIIHNPLWRRELRSVLGVINDE
jgi:hypothetical protein